jgi:hypothetical protein
MTAGRAVSHDGTPTTLPGQNLPPGVKYRIFVRQIDGHGSMVYHANAGKGDFAHMPQNAAKKGGNKSKINPKTS